MYLPSPPPDSAPVRQRRPARRASRSKQLPVYRRTAHFELAARLLVNGVLLTVAGVSLARLIPLVQAQQADLQRMQTAVAIAEQEQARLKADFGRYFDPQQARAIMQEQSGWESASQRQIVWISPESSD